jgi:hypothetical protein
MVELFDEFGGDGAAAKVDETSIGERSNLG